MYWFFLFNILLIGTNFVVRIVMSNMIIDIVVSEFEGALLNNMTRFLLTFDVKFFIFYKYVI